MPVTLECQRCGITFSVAPAHADKRRFCTPSCRVAARADQARACEVCGVAFFVSPAHIRSEGQGRFCSRRCAGMAKRVDILDRLWAKVDKNGPIPTSHPEFGACWLWTGATHESGYGRLVVGADADGRYMYTHHLAWKAASGGEIPKGDGIYHTCDTPRCVRNDGVGDYAVGARRFVRYGHLFSGLPKDNNADRDEKQRLPRGERHAHAKLTAQDVRRIRAIAASGVLNMVELGRLFGVNPSTVGDIVHRRTWEGLE